MAPEDTSLARVRSVLERGTILLVGKEEEVCLVWGDEAAGEFRGLPPGAWAVKTVRVERMREKEHWFLSTTGPARDPQEFEAGKVRTVPVSTGVKFHGGATRNGNAINLEFTLVGNTGRGVSVYHEDRRVAVTYVVRNRKGERLAEGTMNYG